MENRRFHSGLDAIGGFGSAPGNQRGGERHPLADLRDADRPRGLERQSDFHRLERHRLLGQRNARYAGPRNLGHRIHPD